METSSYIMPCDISSTTMALYMTNPQMAYSGQDKPKVLSTIKAIFEQIEALATQIHHDYIGNVGFYQDSCIQLTNIATKTPFFIVNGLGRSDEPIIPDPAKRQQYVEELSKNNLMNRMFIKKDLSNEEQQLLITIKSKYSMPNPRHPENIFNTTQITQLQCDGEQDKGGNFIASPCGNFIFYIEGTSEELIQVLKQKTTSTLVPIGCSFKFGEFRHIDELMCFMPYGENQFKVWIYGLSYLSEKDTSYVEWKTNLDKVAKALFGKSYQECEEKFVTFDITLSSTNTINQPPVFNRLFVEDQQQVNIIFPKSDVTDSSGFKQEVKQLASFIDSKKPLTIHIVDTTPFHGYSGLSQGGNVHCLVKQVMK